MKKRYKTAPWLTPAARHVQHFDKALDRALSKRPYSVGWIYNLAHDLVLALSLQPAKPIEEDDS